MVDSGLLFHLWNKAITTMIYVKNKLSSFTIKKQKITPKKVFLQPSLPYVDHL